MSAPQTLRQRIITRLRPGQPLTLTRRLVIALIVIILLTTTAVSFPAYYLLYTQPGQHATPEIALILLLGVTCGVIVGAVAGGLYIRRLIAPLWKLNKAARALGQGDLHTSINIQAHSPDVEMLVDTLETTRRNLCRTLDDLAAARDWAESLLRSISEGIVTYDDHLTITFFSGGAEQITGWAAASVIGHSVDDVFRPWDGGAFSVQMPPVGGRQTITVMLDDDRPATWSVTRARPTEGSGATLVLHDVTSEAEHHSLQAHLLANISHEFRTPLSGLKVSLELLSENIHTLDPAEVDELLNSLLLSTTSLQNMIDNLLESSKIAAERFALRRGPVEINVILAEALRIMGPVLARRRQPVTVSLPLCPPHLQGDPARLNQVCVNLIANASKYSPVGSAIEVEIQIESEPGNDDRYTRVVVADEGPGIPEHQREVIFHRFMRPVSDEHNPNTQSGTGLGLSVVRAVVEAHGGAVGVRNSTRGGAAFWFTLPILDEE